MWIVWKILQGWKKGLFLKEYDFIKSWASFPRVFFNTEHFLHLEFAIILSLACSILGTFDLLGSKCFEI